MTNSPPGWKPLSPDTSYEAEQVWIEAMQRMTPTERIARKLDHATMMPNEPQLHALPIHVDALVTALESEFYIARTAVDEALRISKSFNLIHLAAR